MTAPLKLPENAMSEAQDSVLWLRANAEPAEAWPEYRAKHGDQLRAIADELERSRAEIAIKDAAVTANIQRGDAYRYRMELLDKELSETRAERDAARAEVERLTTENKTFRDWSAAGKLPYLFADLEAELAAARLQLSAIRTLVMEAGCNSKNCIGMPPDSATQYCCPWHLKRWELLYPPPSDAEPGTP